MREPFRFKQFKINQNRAAMKIGTDSVLLGAWTSVSNNANSILDIGSGTGILALMMAQRTDAQIIDAIEIDADAYEECVENFEDSPWSDRLFCYHASLQEFVDEMDESYDLIICNPPYFKAPASKTNSKNSRDRARFTFSLDCHSLLRSTTVLLRENGTFSIVIPYTEEKLFIETAKKFKLYPQRILNIKGNETSKIKRSLIEFTATKLNNPLLEILVIEKERHIYTPKYINLTKEFYLKMG